MAFIFSFECNFSECWFDNIDKKLCLKYLFSFIMDLVNFIAFLKKCLSLAKGSFTLHILRNQPRGRGFPNIIAMISAHHDQGSMKRKENLFPGKKVKGGGGGGGGQAMIT